MTALNKIQEATNRATAYLRRKGCATIGEHVPCDGLLLVATRVSGATEAVKKHISKTYPDALIIYAAPDEVGEEHAYRRSMAAKIISEERG